MREVEQFLQDHQPKLLRYLDGKAPVSPDEPTATDYVIQVLDEWSARFSGRELDPPTLRERTFWFALYLLEELVEYPPQGNPLPYEGFLMRNLAEVADVLRNWQDLPEGYFATRPGEDFERYDDQG